MGFGDMKADKEGGVESDVEKAVGKKGAFDRES